jgi:hypothetical protein
MERSPCAEVQSVLPSSIHAQNGSPAGQPSWCGFSRNPGEGVLPLSLDFGLSAGRKPAKHFPFRPGLVQFQGSLQFGRRFAV